MSQATDIYLIESLWPDLKVKRQLGSGLFGSVYEVRTEGLVDQDFNFENLSSQQTGPQEDLSLEAAVRNAGNQLPQPERYAIRVLTLPRSLAAGKELARDLNLSRPQDLAAYYKDLVQGVQEEIRQLQDLQFDSPFLKILDYKALKQLQGPGWHVLIRTEFLPSLSAYKPLEETLYTLQNSEAENPEGLEKTSSGPEAFSPSQALALSRDISQALAALHARNLAYGPLLPSRIFREGDYDYKLGGLPLSGLTGSVLARTGVGAWPAPVKVYLAPELADGYPASPASDIFSLGLLLLQLLSPQDFATYLRTKLSASSGDKQGQAGHLPMPHLEADLPDFAEVLAKATAIDPQDRYTSLEAFQKDLQALGQSLEDYLDKPADNVSRPTSIPQERDLVSPDQEALADQDGEAAEAAEVHNTAFSLGENHTLASDSPFAYQEDTHSQELEVYYQARQDAQTYEGLSAEEAWNAGSIHEPSNDSSHEQVWDPEDFPEDEVGYSPTELESLAARPERREVPEEVAAAREETSKRGQAQATLSENSSTPIVKARPAAKSASDTARAGESTPQDAKDGQRRWLLPLLIILSVAALAALIYFGYLFLQNKQPADVKPQAGLEQSGDQPASPTDSEQPAQADHGQTPEDTSGESLAPAASENNTSSTPETEPSAESDQDLEPEQAVDTDQEGPDQKTSPASDSQDLLQPKEALASLQQITRSLARPLNQVQSIRAQLQTQLTRAWQALLTTQAEKAAEEEATKAETSDEENPEVTTEESRGKTDEPNASEPANEPSVTEEASQAADSQPSEQAAGTTYVVQNGDILYTILYNRYGAYEEVVDRVLAVNPQIENINNLPTGLEIFLPDLD